LREFDTVEERGVVHEIDYGVGVDGGGAVGGIASNVPIPIDGRDNGGTAEIVRVFANVVAEYLVGGVI